MQPLSIDEARSRLGALPGWQIEAGELVKPFQFKDGRRARLVPKTAPLFLLFRNRALSVFETAGTRAVAPRLAPQRAVVEGIHFAHAATQQHQLATFPRHVGVGSSFV